MKRSGFEKKSKPLSLSFLSPVLASPGLISKALFLGLGQKNSKHAKKHAIFKRGPEAAPERPVEVGPARQPAQGRAWRERPLRWGFTGRLKAQWPTQGSDRKPLRRSSWRRRSCVRRLALASALALLEMPRRGPAVVQRALCCAPRRKPRALRRRPSQVAVAIN